MKKPMLALLGSLMLSTGASAYAAPVTVSGGIVKFQGDVVAGACTLVAGSKALNVPMGTVKVADLDNGVGTQDSNKTQFTISLEDCAPGISTNVAASFNGTASAGGSVFLADNVPGSATGVGVTIFDYQDFAIIPNGGLSGANTPILQGNTELNYSVAFVSTVDAGGIVPGVVSATANFDLVYD